MSSAEHAILVDLVRERPSLALVLLAEAGVTVPADETLEIVDATFPASVSDRHADLAFVLRDAASAPALVVLLEVQLSVDPEKPNRWLTYQVAAQDRHRCPVALLVVTTDPAVSRWARRPVAVGPAWSFAPFVVGPEEVLRPDEVPEALRTPELVLFLTLVRQRDIDAESLRAAARALVTVEIERASVYTDVLLAIFDEALRRILEAQQMNYTKPISEWGKRHYAEGEAKGEARGEARGEAKGLAEAVLRVLQARGLAVSSEERATILACKDIDRLSRLVERAVATESVASLLVGTPPDAS